MRKSAKIITGLSVAGLAVVAGSAFTGSGLSTSTEVAAGQFIGGTVSQTVEGAQVSNISYRVTSNEEVSGTEITGARVTFAKAVVNGEVSAKFEDGSQNSFNLDCKAVTPATGDTFAAGTTFDCDVLNGGSVLSLAKTFVTVTATKNIA